MDNQEIEIGQSYAYLPAGTPLIEPLRAEIIEGDDRGLQSRWALVYHPDRTKPTKELVFVGSLYGLWDEAPDPRAFAHGNTPFNPGIPWREISQRSYTEITKQRELADRLTAIGIPRARKNYARSGGTEKVKLGVDTRLFLSHDELDLLLSKTETTTATS